jgi:hypothetical protein
VVGHVFFLLVEFTAGRASVFSGYITGGGNRMTAIIDCNALLGKIIDAGGTACE